MTRLGLIREGTVGPMEDGFILSDEKGTTKVTLISIVGRGGTAIAYKGIRNRNGNYATCIVKEYFPKQKEEMGVYQRKQVGDLIQIKSEDREKELQLQEENVRRELETNQEIYFNKNDALDIELGNFPYSYSAEYLCHRGDSSYIVLDSSEGQTLGVKITAEKIEKEEAMHLIYQLLIIIEHLHKRGFLHGDIKPDNLWIRGGGENQNMCLLDFGSAFKPADYQVDLSKMTDQEILGMADKIKKNESIGSNTREYSSVNISRIENQKRLFMTTDYSVERARSLIEIINAIGIRDDLYSVIKVAKNILDATRLDEREKSDIDTVMAHMETVNYEQGYNSVDELRKEFQILETILNRRAHPLVLKRACEQELNQISLEGFDEKLLCEVK